MQGMPPNMQGMPPNMQGIPPNMQGIPVNMQQMDPMAVKQMQKDGRRAVKREKRRIKENQDSENVINLLCCLNVLNALIIIVPVFGNSWNMARFVGTALTMITIRTSMFKFDIEIECDKNWLEDKICSGLKDRLEGDHWIMQAQQMSCNFSYATCDIMTRLHYSTYIIFFCFTSAAILHLLSAGFMYFYWHDTPLVKARSWAVWFLFAAPMLALSGLTLFSILTPELEELPISWSNQMLVFTGGIGILGFDYVDRITYGWCFYWSWVALFFSLLTTLFWPAFFSVHEGEEKAEEEEEEELALAELEGLMMLQDYPSGGGQQGYPGGMTAPSSYGGSMQTYQQGAYQQGSYQQGPYQQGPYQQGPFSM